MATEDRKGPGEEHERPGLERADKAEMTERPDTAPDIASTDEDPDKYVEQTREGLYERAKEVGVEGITPEMSKEELIERLREYRKERGS